MADREKLTELLEEARLKYHVRMKDFPNKYNVIAWHDYFADHLIANGVVVREKGEWVERKEIFNESEGETDAIGCSKCGKSQRKYNRTPFCPNCGADMRGAINNG